METETLVRPTQDLIDPEVKELWVEACESDEFQNSIGYLRSKNAEGVIVGYCCLGVLTELYNRAHPDEDAFTDDRGDVIATEGKYLLSPAVRKWSGLTDALVAADLASDNDKHGSYPIEKIKAL